MLSKILNAHNAIDSPLRNPSRLLVRRDENISGAKGDHRSRYIDWATVEDQEFCNVIALTKQQRRGKELGALHRAKLPSSTV